MVQNLWYLVLAYAVIWAGVFGYLVFLAAQARALRKEVRMLTQVLRDEAQLEPEATPEARVELATEPKS